MLRLSVSDVILVSFKHQLNCFHSDYLQFVPEQHKVRQRKRKAFDQSLFVGTAALKSGNINAALSFTLPAPVSVPFLSTTPTGLNIDGLYRVSGNLAVIQKLRFAVNHGKIQLHCISICDVM